MPTNHSCPVLSTWPDTNLAAATARADTRRLSLANIETACVAPRWGLLRLEASNGLVGYGEFTLEGQTEDAIPLVQRMAAMIREQGLDLRNPATFLDALKSKNFYARDGIYWSAAAGLEMAMWDIIGKELNRPIHALWGGAVRDKVEIYRWAGGDFYHGDPIEPALEQVRALVAAGIKYIKLNACPPMHTVDISHAIMQSRARAQAIREEVGPHIGLAFDFHGRVTPANAIILAQALREFNPLFIEEPVSPEFNQYLPSIAQGSGLRIATGERMFEPEMFASLCAQGGVHILQPDLVHIGGLLRTRDVATLATCFGLGIAPHCPLSPLAFLACIHAVAHSRAGFIQESSWGIHYSLNAQGVDTAFTDYLLDPSVLTLDANGCLKVPTKPGLGIELNWEAVRAAGRAGIPWQERGPIAPDGSRLRW